MAWAVPSGTKTCTVKAVNRIVTRHGVRAWPMALLTSSFVISTPAFFAGRNRSDSVCTDRGGEGRTDARA
jgi:hypothetical protein